MNMWMAPWGDIDVNPAIVTIPKDLRDRFFFRTWQETSSHLMVIRFPGSEHHGSKCGGDDGDDDDDDDDDDH